MLTFCMEVAARRWGDLAAIGHFDVAPKSHFRQGGPNGYGPCEVKDAKAILKVRLNANNKNPIFFAFKNILND